MKNHLQKNESQQKNTRNQKQFMLQFFFTHKSEFVWIYRQNINISHKAFDGKQYKFCAKKYTYLVFIVI